MTKGKSLGENWTIRVRRGLPSMTPKMLPVLQFLREADAREFPFQPLEWVHARTLHALLERDWIFKSQGLDGVRCKITGRGKHALKIYEPQIRRGDGVCPTCCTRPRHVTRNGRVEGYCKQCLSASEKRSRQLGRRGKNPDSLCPHCHKRTRAVQAGGAVNTYCKPCDRALKRQRNRRARKEQLAAAARGVLPVCRNEGCDCLVHYTGKSIYDLCRTHWQEYMNAYNDRRRPDSSAAKARALKRCAAVVTRNFVIRPQRTDG